MSRNEMGVSDLTPEHSALQQIIDYSSPGYNPFARVILIMASHVQSTEWEIKLVVKTPMAEETGEQYVKAWMLILCDNCVTFN